MRPTKNKAARDDMDSRVLAQRVSIPALDGFWVRLLTVH
jgi:hypothetical protein